MSILLKRGIWHRQTHTKNYKKNGEIIKNNVPITIKHLLMMTSGLSYDVATAHIEKIQKEKGSTAKLRDFIPAFAKQELLFEPGTSFEYGYGLGVRVREKENAWGLKYMGIHTEILREIYREINAGN